MFQNDRFKLPSALLKKLVQQSLSGDLSSGLISAESKTICGMGLAKLRIRKGLSAAQVTEQTGISADALVLLEAGLGEQALSEDQITALAMLLSDTQFQPDVIQAVIQVTLGRSHIQYDRLLSDIFDRLPGAAAPAQQTLEPLNVEYDDKLALLRSVPLFARLNDPSLQELARQLAVEQFEPGEIIFKQNTIGRTMYIVVSGEVRIYMTSAKGREMPVRMLGAGGFFGEMALLDGQLRSASVQAVQPTITLTLQSKEFWEVVVSVPSMSVIIIMELTRRLRELLLYSEYLAEILPSDRVADTLTEFARRRNANDNDIKSWKARLDQWQVMAHLSQNEADVPSNERAILMELLQIFQSAICC